MTPRASAILIASYLLARAPSAGKELVAAMRMIALVEAVAKQVNQDATDAILKGPMVLPDIVEQLPDPLPQPPVEPPPQERAQTLVREIEALHGRAEKLEQIMADLALHEVDELVVREGDEEKPLSALFLPEETEDRRPVETLGSSIVARAAARKNVFLARTAIERLPEDAMQTLPELGADPRRSALAEISQTITNQLGAINNQLFKKHKDPAWALVEGIELIETGVIEAVIEPVDDPEAEDPPWSPAVQLPTTHGTASRRRGGPAAGEAPARALRAR